MDIKNFLTGLGIALLAVLLMRVAERLFGEKLPGLPPPADADSIPLTDVLQQIRSELAAMRERSGESIGLKLHPIELTFAVTETRTDGGKLTLSVPVLSKDQMTGKLSLKGETKTTVSLTLRPDELQVLSDGAEVPQIRFAALMTSLRAALRAAREPRPNLPKLQPEKVSLDLEFVLTRDSSVEGGFDVALLGVSANSGLVQIASNKMKLVWGKDLAP